MARKRFIQLEVATCKGCGKPITTNAAAEGSPVYEKYGCLCAECFKALDLSEFEMNMERGAELA
jgi:hypothetical protein